MSKVVIVGEYNEKDLRASKTFITTILDEVVMKEAEKAGVDLETIKFHISKKRDIISLGYIAPDDT